MGASWAAPRMASGENALGLYVDVEADERFGSISGASVELVFELPFCPNSVRFCFLWDS